MGSKNRKHSSARDRVKQSAAQAGPGGGGGTMFNLPEDVEYYNPEKGRVTLRILPYEVTDKNHPDGDLAPKDSLWYRRPFKRFRQVGVEKKPHISLLSVGKACPIFEYYREAKADPKIPEKEADKAKPQDCVMYNVQVIDKKGKPGDVMFFWMSYALFEKHLKKELNDPDNDEYLAFMDLEGGYDIKIRWEEESFDGNKYLEAGRISFVERDDDIDDDILDDLVNLDECLVVLDYDQLKNVWLEIDDDDEPAGEKKDPDDEGDDKPDLDAEELVDMSKAKMKKFIKKHDLDTDLDQDEDDMREELAKELKIKLPKEKDDESGLPDLDVDDLVDMNKKDLKRFNKKHDLDIDIDQDEDEIRADIAEKFDITLPKKKAGKTSKSSKGDDECSKGHDWGEDCDEYPKDCDKCDVWDACMAKQEELKAKK